ncbi:MAG: TraB/GumN family protein [Methanomicrobia archaeon]|nr:TraB/GumN family protein [Methanomicrobia archaeon]
MIEKIITENREITLIGTAHIFKESVDEVKETIISEMPEAVCIELDPKRYYGLLTGQRMSFVDIVKAKGIKTGVIAGFLGYVERKLGEDMGVFPGKEMITAAQYCKNINAKLYLIDRDAEITVEKMTRIPFKEKLTLVKALILSPFQKEKIRLDLNKENIESLIEGLRNLSPYLYRVLIEERDQFMAEKIKEIEEKRIVVVVGAGHVKGILERITF